MTKLKTLKDLNFDEFGYFINDGYSDKYRLKRLAIKHIKHRQKETKGDIKNIGDYEEVVNFDKGAIEVLITVFNITQKDIDEYE